MGENLAEFETPIILNCVDEIRRFLVKSFPKDSSFLC